MRGRERHVEDTEYSRCMSRQWRSTPAIGGKNLARALRFTRIEIGASYAPFAAVVVFPSERAARGVSSSPPRVGSKRAISDDAFANMRERDKEQSAEPEPSP